MRDELDIPMPAMAPSYRPSVRRNEQMDPATKRLAIFAGVIGTALLGLVAVWAFTGHHRGEVPVIEADSGPVRVKPANPGGLQVPGANDEILSGETGAKETVAPGPEVPAPQALKAQEQAAAEAAAPAASEAAQPALRPPAAAEGTTTVRPIPGARPTGPLAVQSAPHAAPAAKPAVARPAASAAPPAPAPAPAAATVAPARGGDAFVQLAAVGSDSAAHKEWGRLSKKYPDLLGGHAPAITRTEYHGKTFWRVRTGGFADQAQATAFCHRVKAKGGACTVASF